MDANGLGDLLAHGAWLPETRFAVVKQATANRAAVSLSPARSRELIESEARAAVADARRVKPISIEGPLVCRIEAKNVVLADLFSSLPRSRRIDPLNVAFDAAKPSEVLGALQLLAASAAAV